ncbi:MAG: NUDIX domain-containing protein [Planctomycetota bacterium]
MIVRAAGVVIAHRDGGVTRLLLLRNRKRDDWGFAKGHCDPGESNFSAAKRELAEETGIVNCTILPGFRFVSRYYLPAGPRAGQLKHVVYYLGTVASTEVLLSSEHSEFAWAAPEDCEKLLPFGELQTLARDAFAFLAETKF